MENKIEPPILTLGANDRLPEFTRDKLHGQAPVESTGVVLATQGGAVRGAPEASCTFSKFRASVEKQLALA